MSEKNNGGCPPDCGHTKQQHTAFDRGVKAGENGDGAHWVPYRNPSLVEAWLTGRSVGIQNRKHRIAVQ